MSIESRGRIAPSPPPPFLKGTSDSFVGAYPWNNVNKEAIGRDRPLTRAELRQVQGVLNRIDRLPFSCKRCLHRVITSSAVKRALWVGCIS
jgi:large subunit ribosomal protein L30